MCATCISDLNYPCYSFPRAINIYDGCIIVLEHIHQPGKQFFLLCNQNNIYSHLEVTLKALIQGRVSAYNPVYTLTRCP
jgi:hypothetical protein